MRLAGDSELKLYGIFGYPLAHTVSPAMQNRAFDHYRLKSMYFAFERPPARFRSLMRNIKSLLLDGFNVTVPYKEIVLRHLNQLSPEARAIGAVNTVKKVNGRWMGYNTDVYGFLAGLKECRFSSRGRAAVILGAGGSARAVSFALAKSGVRSICVANRTQNRAQNLVRKFRAVFPGVRWMVARIGSKDLTKALSGADLIVNATKVGLKRSDGSLISRRSFPKRKVLVYDLIYRPRRTALLGLAQRLGHRVINGETMLLHQGAKAFEIWTGRRAPLREMKQAMHDALGARS